MSVSKSYLVNRWNAVLCLQKKNTVVVLIVVIAIVLVVDLVNTLFLCITGQSDWTLVNLCTKFSLKSFGIYHQSSVLFVYIIFFFFLFFLFPKKAHGKRNTSTVLKRWGSRSTHRDLPPKLHFSSWQAVRTRVCVCVSQRKKKCQTNVKHCKRLQRYFK